MEYDELGASAYGYQGVALSKLVSVVQKGADPVNERHQQKKKRQEVLSLPRVTSLLVNYRRDQALFA